MQEEDRVVTVQFLSCGSCGHVFTATAKGKNACPKCQAPLAAGKELVSRFSKQTVGGHVLFTLLGPMYKMQELEELRTQLDLAMDADAESIAFHFNGASYLDSSMLGQMVRTLKEMASRGKATSVVTADAQVVESLQVLDLDRILPVYPSLDAYRMAMKIQ